MDPHIALIVIVAATFHALWNAAVKSGRDHLLSLTGINVATGVIALPLAFFVGVPAVDSWPYIVASGILHFGYYIALSEAYKYGDFSEAYPIARGAAPILVTLWGVLILRENMSLIEGISLAGVIGGLLIFTLRSVSDVVRDQKALIAALVTSLFIGGYTLVDGVGGRLSLNVPAYMVWLYLIDAVPILIYAFYKRRASEVVALVHDWKLLFVGAALAFLSYGLVVWSMTQAPIPMVSALRETSIVIAALIGTFYFREKAGFRRILASLIIFCSVALLAFD